MMHCLQGWACCALKKDMKGWTLGGRPDLLSENEDDDPIDDNKMADISGVSMELCLSLRE